MKQQSTLMLFDPATGKPKPFPSNAQQWREYHGDVAWLYNPWSGPRRDPRDIGQDVFGHLIIPEGESVKAESTNQPKLVLVLPDGDTRNLQVVHDELVNGERLVSVKIAGDELVHDALLEEAKAICKSIAEDRLQKMRTILSDDPLSQNYFEGQSDGAKSCARAIDALKKSVKQ